MRSGSARPRTVVAVTIPVRSGAAPTREPPGSARPAGPAARPARGARRPRTAPGPAIDRLLGHKVLRRESAGVSTESALRGARASAALEGVDVPLADLRAGHRRRPAGAGRAPRLRRARLDGRDVVAGARPGAGPAARAGRRRPRRQRRARPAGAARRAPAVRPVLPRHRDDVGARRPRRGAGARRAGGPGARSAPRTAWSPAPPPGSPASPGGSTRRRCRCPRWASPSWAASAYDEALAGYASGTSAGCRRLAGALLPGHRARRARGPGDLREPAPRLSGGRPAEGEDWPRWSTSRSTGSARSAGSGWAPGSSARGSGATATPTPTARRATSSGGPASWASRSSTPPRSTGSAAASGSSGEALGHERGDVVVASKIFPVAPFPPVIRHRWAGSARRLGLTRIPLYQVHQPNPLVPDSVIMPGLREPAGRRPDRRGRCLQLLAGPVAGGRRRARPAGDQQPGAVLPRPRRAAGRPGAVRRAREPAGDRLQPAGPGAARRPVHGRPTAPAASARSTRCSARRTCAGSRRCSTSLREVADAHQARPAQIALAWLIGLPRVVVIPGASSVEQLEHNAAAAAISLAADEQAALTAAARAFTPVSGRAHRGRRRPGAGRGWLSAVRGGTPPPR